MTTLAIVHPTDLVGKELCEQLEGQRNAWQELRLLSTQSDEIGTLAQVRGEAALVLAASEDSLAGVDVAFFCGPIAANRPLLAATPAATAKIVLSPDATLADGHPTVAEINLETATRELTLLSPHAGVIGLAHLLAPLLPLAPQTAIATLLQPLSVFGTQGLDEALEQTRNLLTFQPRPSGILPTQVAFNLFPAQGANAHLVDLLHTVLRSATASQPQARLSEVSLQVLQAGIFHSFGISLYLRFAPDPGLAAVRSALQSHLVNELVDEPELLGPIDAAARDEVLIGPISPAPGQPGGYWIWAVLDNLTRGGVTNALQILDAITFQVAH